MGGLGSRQTGEPTPGGWWEQSMKINQHLPATQKNLKHINNCPTSCIYKESVKENQRQQLEFQNGIMHVLFLCMGTISRPVSSQNS